MIICGYAGIGKSFLAHTYPNVIDLESTPFEKDWDRYAKCAVHYHKQGYLVLVSCHKEIRERLLDAVHYGDRLTIVPDINSKSEYESRYKSRGNSEKFIKNQMDNWETWLDEKKNRLLREHWVIMDKNENLVDTIIRLSKKDPDFFCNYDGCPCSYSCKDVGCANPLVVFANKFK